MTVKQMKALRFLWYTYGNGGCCHTPQNHRYLQLLLAEKDAEAQRLAHIITPECREALARVLRDDYSELGEVVRKIVEAGTL